MKIAIQKQDSPLCPGHTSTYSQRWEEYCQNHNIDYEMVDCYDTNIISRLKDFTALLWHFHHKKGVDLLMARNVLVSAEQMGLVVYPNAATCWHFDDKVAEKYLLESVNAPLAPTYVFYDEAPALEWLRSAEYPLVRKLRRGAGSSNVGLIHNFSEAKRYTRKAFRDGFEATPGPMADLSHRLRRYHSFGSLVKKAIRYPSILAEQHRRKKSFPREKGYVLFQKFIPDNTHDTRIAVIGNRAWGFVRYVRENDFRASGSGNVNLDISNVNIVCVKIGFQIMAQLKLQSAAFDFVFSPDGKPWILEMSYGFPPDNVHRLGGYWDRALVWHEGQLWPEYAVLEDLIENIRQCKKAKEAL